MIGDDGVNRELLGFTKVVWTSWFGDEQCSSDVDDKNTNQKTLVNVEETR